MLLSTVATLPSPLQRPGIWGSGNRKHIAYCQPLLSPLILHTGWILQRTKAMGLQSWEQQAQSTAALGHWMSGDLHSHPWDHNPYPPLCPRNTGSWWPLPVGTTGARLSGGKAPETGWPSPPAFRQKPGRSSTPCTQSSGSVFPCLILKSEWMTMNQQMCEESF